VTAEPVACGELVTAGLLATGGVEGRAPAAEGAMAAVPAAAGTAEGTIALGLLVADVVAIVAAAEGGGPAPGGGALASRGQFTGGAAATVALPEAEGPTPPVTEGVATVAAAAPEGAVAIMPLPAAAGAAAIVALPATAGAAATA